MAKISAYGARLRYDDPDSADTRGIHWVADISGPEISVETIDVTTHDSPDGFNEFIAGMADGGEVTFDLVFDDGPTGHYRILDLIEAKALVNFRLTFPTAGGTFIIPADFNATTGWTVGGSWSINTGAGTAICANATPANDSLSRTVVGLAIDEVYTLTIRTGAAASGTIRIGYAAVVLHDDIVVAPNTTYEIKFRATSASGALAIVVPAGSGAANVVLDSVQVTGYLESDASLFYFPGLFTKASPTFPVKDALRASCSIKVSGKPELITT